MKFDAFFIWACIGALLGFFGGCSLGAREGYHAFDFIVEQITKEHEETKASLKGCWSDLHEARKPKKPDYSLCHYGSQR